MSEPVDSTHPVNYNTPCRFSIILKEWIDPRWNGEPPLNINGTINNVASSMSGALVAIYSCIFSEVI